MTSKERQRRMREIEQHAAKLVTKGWRVERIEHVDEDGEAFRTTIAMSCDGKEGGTL